MSELCPAQFAAVELAFHRELSRRDFGTEDLAVLQLFNERSFQRGQSAAYLPLQKFIEEATGLEKSAVSRTLARLRAWAVIFTDRREFYWLNVNFASWSAPAKRRLGTAWDGVLTPLELPEETPELRYVLREVFLAKVAGAYAWISDLSNLPVLDRGASAGSTPERRDQAEVNQPGTDGGKRQESARSDSTSMASDGTEPAAEPQAPPLIAMQPGGVCDGESRGVRGQVLAHGHDEKPDGVSGGAVDLKSTGGVDKKSTRVCGTSAKAVDLKSTNRVRPNDYGPPRRLILNQLGSKPAAEAAPAGFPPQTPPSGSLNVEPLNVKRSTRNELSAALPRKRHMRTIQITYDEECRLMALIKEAIPGDMEQSGAFWRTRVVRCLRPEIIEESVANYRDRIRTGYVFRSGAAWLMRDMAKLAGIKSMGDLPAGLPPL